MKQVAKQVQSNIKKPSIVDSMQLANPQRKKNSQKSLVINEENKNYSPIRTRLNLRLLESIEQAKLERDRETNSTSNGLKRIRRSEPIGAGQHLLNSSNKSHEGDSSPKQLKKAKSLRFTKSDSPNESIVSCESSLNHSLMFSPKINETASSSFSQFMFPPPPPPTHTTSRGSASIHTSPTVIQSHTNPMNWTVQQVKQYVNENKFDPTLLHLIEDQVTLMIQVNLYFLMIFWSIGARRSVVSDAQLVNDSKLHGTQTRPCDQTKSPSRTTQTVLCSAAILSRCLTQKALLFFQFSVFFFNLSKYLICKYNLINSNSR